MAEHDLVEELNVMLTVKLVGVNPTLVDPTTVLAEVDSVVEPDKPKFFITIKVNNSTILTLSR